MPEHESSSNDAVKHEFTRAFRVLCFAGTVLALWAFVKGTNFHNLGLILGRTRVWPLVMAAALNLASQSFKAFKWKLMLAPIRPVPFGRLLRYEFTAQAASSTLPARAGELLRVGLLRQDGVAPSVSAALIALKKHLEGVGLAVLVLPVPWLVPGLSAWTVAVIYLFASLMIGSLAVLAVAARRMDPANPPRRLAGLVEGMAFLRESRRTLAAFCRALAGEAADFGVAVLVLYALRINQPVAAGALILLMVDLTNLLPAAPGQLGTTELGALTGLDLLHVPHAAGLAFALLFHAQQALPQVAIGMPFELSFFAGHRDQHRRAPRPGRGRVAVAPAAGAYAAPAGAYAAATPALAGLGRCHELRRGIA